MFVRLVAWQCFWRRFVLLLGLLLGWSLCAYGARGDFYSFLILVEFERSRLGVGPPALRSLYKLDVLRS